MTDAELQEVEREAKALVDEGDGVGSDQRVILSLLAEVRRLRGQRCETCIHWDPWAQWRGPDYQDWGLCRLAGSVDGYDPDHPETLARAQGPDNASLDTHRSFGCIQWAAKERSDD